MLLDTCALLWLAKGGGDISRDTLAKIDSAPAVYVSAITGFEISWKYVQGKLVLASPPSEWLRLVAEHHDISVIPLDLEICIAAAELPAVHQDPCDRFIIATARREGLAVVTADLRFKEYGVDVLI